LGEGDPGFLDSFRLLRSQGRWDRRLFAAGLGTAGFSMQDVLLEPYGGQILGLSVGSTTALTALLAGGGAMGFIAGARWLSRGADPHRLAGYGALIGIFAFALVILAAPLDSVAAFAAGSALIGIGAGLFAHAVLTACMRIAPPDRIGLTLGLWGAVQATAAGCAIALGGLLRDGISMLAERGALGDALAGPVVGYVAVYAAEIGLLFLTLAAVGPLVQATRRPVPIAQPTPGAAGPAPI
jgi:BCD family chlorophyll transporter-like MFS transporter